METTVNSTVTRGTNSSSAFARAVQGMADSHETHGGVLLHGEVVSSSDYEPKPDFHASKIVHSRNDHQRNEERKCHARKMRGIHDAKDFGRKLKSRGVRDVDAVLERKARRNRLDGKLPAVVRLKSSAKDGMYNVSCTYAERQMSRKERRFLESDSEQVCEAMSKLLIREGVEEDPGPPKKEVVSPLSAQGERDLASLGLKEPPKCAYSGLWIKPELILAKPKHWICGHCRVLMSKPEHGQLSLHPGTPIDASSSGVPDEARPVLPASGSSTAGAEVQRTPGSTSGQTLTGPPKITDMTEATAPIEPDRRCEFVSEADKQDPHLCFAGPRLPSGAPVHIGPVPISAPIVTNLEDPKIKTDEDPISEIVETGFQLQNGICCRHMLGFVSVRDEVIVPEVINGKVVTDIETKEKKQKRVLVDRRSLLSRHQPMLPHKIKKQTATVFGVTLRSKFAIFWSIVAVVVLALVWYNPASPELELHIASNLKTNRVDEYLYQMQIESYPALVWRSIYDVWNFTGHVPKLIADRLKGTWRVSGCWVARRFTRLAPLTVLKYCPSDEMLKLERIDNMARLVNDHVQADLNVPSYSIRGILLAVGSLVYSLRWSIFIFLCICVKPFRFSIVHVPHWTGAVLQETMGQSIEDTLANLPMIIRRSQGFDINVGDVPAFMVGTKWVVATVLEEPLLPEIFPFQLRPLPSGLIGSRKKGDSL